MIILAIETSCDETAAAIVEFNKNKVRVLSNIVSSQIRTHSKYGGVVPALASRMHLKNMTPVLRRAFQRAGINKNKVDYIAITKGPGLIPALIVGVGAAKALSYSLDKPLVAVNHLEGHIYANWLKESTKSIKLKVCKACPREPSGVKGQDRNNYNLWKPEFPVLCLIVSGGHTQLVLMKKDLNYKIVGETVDDAAGEAFDKVAKLLGLKYPGGPLIEKIAKKGDRNKFNFTRPMMNSRNYNFSFSGLKTAALYEVRGKNEATPRLYDKQYQADVAASFQQAAIDVLISKTIRAAKEYKVKNILLGGGVSANKELQKQFCEIINKEIPNSKFQIPDSKLTTDNALMIAVAAYYNVINNKNIRSWKNVKADANLRLK